MVVNVTDQSSADGYLWLITSLIDFERYTEAGQNLHCIYCKSLCTFSLTHPFYNSGHSSLMNSWYDTSHFSSKASNLQSLKHCCDIRSSIFYTFRFLVRYLFLFSYIVTFQQPLAPILQSVLILSKLASLWLCKPYFIVRILTLNRIFKIS